MEKDSQWDDDVVQWYVLRFLYRDQPKVRARLEEDGIETFSPVKQVIRIINGKRVPRWELAIWDLLFVHAPKKVIDPYVREYANLQFRFKSGGRKGTPLVVPEKQMNDFMTAVKTSRKQPLYFAPDEIDVAKGTRVRMIGGMLDGYEGILLKVSGSRKKRLIIEVPGTLFAAVEVETDLIERIEIKET